jgi:hypothetical protein
VKNNDLEKEALNFESQLFLAGPAIATVPG